METFDKSDKTQKSQMLSHFREQFSSRFGKYLPSLKSVKGDQFQARRTESVTDKNTIEFLLRVNSRKANREMLKIFKDNLEDYIEEINQFKD